MFVFTMILASPEWKRDSWSRVSEICNNSIRSVLNQTSKNFRLVLVCNEPPQDMVEDEKIILQRTDLPCPTDYKGVLRDINLKIKLAMSVARQFAPAYIMRIDADDFVSNRVVAYTEQHPNENGWYFKWGYCYDYWTQDFCLQPNFHLMCGTAHIINCTEKDFPDSLSTADEEWLNFIWEHQGINELLEPMGRKLKPFPFLAVVRSVNTGVNSEAQPPGYTHALKRFIRKNLLRRKINEKIINEFKLPVDHPELLQI